VVVVLRADAEREPARGRLTVLRFRTEVRIGFPTETIVGVLQAAALWSLRSGVDVEIVSVNDGAEALLPTSLHGYDLAIDLVTMGDQAFQLAALHLFLWKSLPASFTVQLEGDHVHVEANGRTGRAARPR